MADTIKKETESKGIPPCELRIRATFQDDVLGMQPASEDIWQEHIASKAPEGSDEKEALNSPEALEERGLTIFHSDPEGRPCIKAYQIKGFLKEMADNIRARKGSAKGTVWVGAKSKISKHVFVEALSDDGGDLDTVLFHRGDGSVVMAHDSVCERSLRASGPKGPQTSIARSWAIAKGCYVEFRVESLGVWRENQLLEILSEGKRAGFGQWRGSGKGRFTIEIIDQATTADTSEAADAD